MSGPKVVRIVTREEVIQVCEGHLARIDAAIATWTQVLERNGLADETAVQEVQRRRRRFADWMKADRFDEVQKHAPPEVEWLNADLERRLEAKFTAEEGARRAERNVRRTAASLLENAIAKQVSLPADIQGLLEAGRDGRSLKIGALDAAVARAFALLLANGPASGPTANQRELAQRLKAGEAPQSLEAWIAARDQTCLGSDEDPRLAAAERGLAQVVALAGEAAAAALTARMMAVRQERDPARRGLLLDALALELAAAQRLHRELSALRQECFALQGEASAVGAADSCQTHLAAAQAGFDATDPVTTRAALEAVRIAMVPVRAARAAAASREAILRGLQSLGYEVQEGMATAWAKDGRLVVRDPRTKGYGVELGGRGDAGKLQVRAVAFEGTAADPTADRAAETNWCGDFTRLREVLAANGADVAVERSTPVGAHQVKRVPDEDSYEDDSTVLRRTL